MEDEKMAVVVQQLTGSACGDYFYPAISGVAGRIPFLATGYAGMATHTDIQVDD